MNTSEPFALPTMDEIIANSFLDFHTKGLHYVCLRRSPMLTTKLYFFEGDVSALPEVVAPHDHRYNFRTTVLRGTVENRLYMPRSRSDPGAEVYQRFEYRTPLNGGNGFTWAAEDCLAVTDAKTFERGERYLMSHDAIHTIQIRSAGTLLELEQYEDRVPINRPTATFTRHREPPSLSGLYRKPTPDDVLRLLGMTAVLSEWRQEAMQ